MFNQAQLETIWDAVHQKLLIEEAQRHSCGGDKSPYVDHLRLVMGKIQVELDKFREP